MKIKQSFLVKVCLLSLIVILAGAQLFAQRVAGMDKSVGSLFNDKALADSSWLIIK